MPRKTNKTAHVLNLLSVGTGKDEQKEEVDKKEPEKKELAPNIQFVDNPTSPADPLAGLIKDTLTKEVMGDSESESQSETQSKIPTQADIISEHLPVEEPESLSADQSNVQSGNETEVKTESMEGKVPEEILPESQITPLPSTQVSTPVQPQQHVPDLVDHQPNPQAQTEAQPLTAQSETPIGATTAPPATDTSETKPEATTVPQTATASETKPEATTVPQATAVSETKPEAATIPQAATASETKPEATTVPQATAAAETKPEATTAPQATAAETKPEATPVPQATAASVAQTETIPVPSPVAQSEPDVETDYQYVNIMDILVDRRLDEFMHKFDTCTCDRCKMDAKAHALSNLPPKYIVMPKSSFAPLISFYTNKYNINIITELTKACLAIINNPRH